MTKETGILLVAMVIMIAALFFILFMIVSLLRQGDERRQMILMKTCATTFIFHICGLLLDTISSFFPETSFFYDPISPSINHLVGISVLFAITLAVYKRKYGN